VNDVNTIHPMEKGLKRQKREIDFSIKVESLWINVLFVFFITIDPMRVCGVDISINDI